MTLAKYLNEMINMFGSLFGMNAHIIHKDFQKISKVLLEGMAHQPLKGGRCIGETKRHHLVRKYAPFNGEDGLVLVLYGN